MKRFLSLLLVITFAGVAAQDATDHSQETGFTVERDADVPELPFEDNPDPTLCGIPEPWGEDDSAWLSGLYEGELVQEGVLLYDSHLRRSVVGSAPSGAEIEIVLFQVNPSLNYYFVRTVANGDVQEGWIPAPFVSFDVPD